MKFFLWENELMEIIYTLSFFLLLTSAYAQVQLSSNGAYFLYKDKKFKLDMTSLSNKAQQRIFGHDDQQKKISYWLKHRPSQKADIFNDMSKVRNQGQRGTCSIFATMALVEHYHNKNADYSEQCLAKFSNDKDSNTVYRSLAFIGDNKGVYKENDCPYRDPAEHIDWIMGDDDRRQELVLEARNDIPDIKNATKIYPNYTVHRVDVDDLSASEAIKQIQANISSKHPVSAAIYIAGKEQWGEGMITNIPSEEEIKKSCPKKTLATPAKKECGTHAIVFTGFDDDRRLLYFKNSWDETWGLDRSYNIVREDEDKIGYGAMSYAYFAKFRINDLITLH